MFKTISIDDLINQPNKQVDFLVDKFEDMVEPENIEFPHTHNFYEILWVTKGKSNQTIDYKNYSFSADTLFFISPANPIHSNGKIRAKRIWQNLEKRDYK